jgi:hypothetical protein
MVRIKGSKLIILEFGKSLREKLVPLRTVVDDVSWNF